MKDMVLDLGREVKIIKEGKYTKSCAIYYEKECNKGHGSWTCQRNKTQRQLINQQNQIVHRNSVENRKTNHELVQNHIMR